MLLDKERALELLGGDEEMLMQIYDMFFDYAPNILKDLEQAILNNNVNDIERLSHSLKSNAGTIGAEKLRGLAYNMEMAAKSNDMEAFKANFENFKILLQEVLKEIDSLRRL
ncbi:MAG: Hpt domain-containing protein [Thermodesulfovibrionales bacterium]|nr:Hpt domain-containing protein [Thermodesulfovibrionales bacterium]